MKGARRPAICAVGLLCALAAGCGGGSSSSSNGGNNTLSTSGANVAPITVNSGPTGNYVNGAFASVQVCVPGSSTCQTIDGVLVDTGSSGLRILSSTLTISLPQQNASDGNPVVECFPFVSGYTWGPVQTADVLMAGEKASSTPVQVVGTNTAVPSSCSSFGASSNTLETLGANGILGVGEFAQDCGGDCTQTEQGFPEIYYECPSSGCKSIGESLTQQVQNPVTLFATDNNGVVVELPAVSGSEASVSGSLVFGIGTQSNNSLGSAAVYTADANTGNFTATYKGTGYSGSFIDSGSNGYFFLDAATTGLPYCDVTSGNPTGSGFYCPSSTASVSTSVQGTNGASGSVDFSVENADTLFANPADFVFADLGGDFPGAFDFGLPFFFGRNVFVAIEGKSAPSGTAPYWAY